VLLARLVLNTDLRGPDRLAIIATLVGLTLVGISAGEEPTREITHWLKICILLGIPVLIALGVAALKLKKSIVLSVLSGAAFTGSALAARSVHFKDESISGLLSEPLLWAVLVYAALALALHATALMRGSVGAVTAAMWSTEVLVASIIGAVALGDHVRHGWALPAIAGIAITLAATLELARSPAQNLDPLAHSAHNHPAAQGRK
jgi:hypothetical protein